jgi:hypothetical protein
MTPRALDMAARDDPWAKRRSKRCALCGRAFGCRQGEPGCWCESIELDRETLAQIRSLADDCICSSCLGTFARQGQRADAPPDGKAPSRRASQWAKAIPHAAVRSRGVSLVWGACAAAFLVGALLLGLVIGPVGIGAGSIAGSALSHLPLLGMHSRLAAID